MPTPIPSVPANDRKTSFAPVTPTTDFQIDFDVWNDASDLDVYVNGDLVTTGWTLVQSDGSPVLTSTARPLVAPKVRFDTALSSGTVVTYGRRVSARSAQATEGAPVTARDFNRSISELVAVAQELRRDADTIIGTDFEDAATTATTKAAEAAASALTATTAAAALGTIGWSTVASAATVNLAAVATIGVKITGTTTITSFGTGGTAGMMRRIYCVGSFQITHGASLTLPSGASIAAAAGDIFEAILDASNVWRVTAYERSTGRPIIGETIASTAEAAAATDNTKMVTPARALDAIAAALPGFLTGLTLTRSAATTISVATGAARNEGAGTARIMTLGSAITKVLAATWAAGTGANGLDTGAVANTTWYHVHLIRKDSDGTLDLLYSLSPTSPTMPTGYTARRRLGSVRTDGSANILNFTQSGDQFLWDSAVVDVDAQNPGTAAVTRALTVPTGLRVQALIIGASYGGTTASVTAFFSALDKANQGLQDVGTASLTAMANVCASGGGARWGFSPMTIRTDTSAQIRSRLQTSGASDRIGIITEGWIDPRGR